MAESPAQARIEQTFRSIERAAGLQFCLKIFDSRKAEGTLIGKLSGDYRMHRTEFCAEVKRTRRPLCLECDLCKVPALCETAREPFVHTCHAGGCEIIVPVFVEDRLAAVAYLGQFRLQDSQPKGLPLLKPEALDHLLGVSQLVRSYLAEALAKPCFGRETSPGYRKEAISLFLQTHLQESPGLADLARHLGISTPRTAHAVIEATGASFTALRDSIRLERARRLLQTTYQKIAEIGFECGFSSSQYFHRFFRHRTGMTPGAFRRKYRTEV